MLVRYYGDWIESETRVCLLGLQENEEEDEGPIFVNDADVLEEFDVDEEGTLVVSSVLFLCRLNCVDICGVGHFDVIV
jgi:hypothetical protein